MKVQEIVKGKKYNLPSAKGATTRPKE